MSNHTDYESHFQTFYTAGPMVKVKFPNGECEWMPEGAYEPTDGKIVAEMDEAYTARNSAPGFLDCTPWTQPHATAKGALEELIATYGAVCDFTFYDRETEEELGSCTAFLDDMGDDPISLWCSDNGYGVDDIIPECHCCGIRLWGGV